MRCPQIAAVLTPPLHNSSWISCDRTKGMVANTTHPALTSWPWVESRLTDGLSIFSHCWKGPGPITGTGYIVLLTSAPTVHLGSSEIKRSLEFKLTELPFPLSQPPVLLCQWRVMEEQNKLSEASMQIVTASKSADSDSLRRRSDSC